MAKKTKKQEPVVKTVTHTHHELETAAGGSIADLHIYAGGRIEMEIHTTSLDNDTAPILRDFLNKYLPE